MINTGRILAGGGVAIGLAFLFPIVGFGAGAYFAATAAAGAGMGTGAVIALGAAGAIGGALVGKIMSAITLIGAAVIGLTAIATASEKTETVSVRRVAKVKEAADVKAEFKAAQAPAGNDNTVVVDAPAAKPNIPKL